MLTTTRAPEACSAGRSSANHAPNPGPWRPTLLSMPASTSCTLGAGLPGHGSTDSDFTTTAARSPSAPYAASSVPCPDVPEAVMTGLTSSTPPTRVESAAACPGVADPLIAPCLWGQDGDPAVGGPRAGATARVRHACRRRPRRGQGGQARHLVGHRRHADVLAVRPGSQASRRVHHQLHLALRDEVHRVGCDTLLPHLGDESVHGHPLGAQVAGRAQRRHDGEAQCAKSPCDLEAGRLVTVGQREEHRARVGQPRARRHLAPQRPGRR